MCADVLLTHAVSLRLPTTCPLQVLHACTSHILSNRHNGRTQVCHAGASVPGPPGLPAPRSRW